MATNSPVNEGQCDERNGKLHERIDSLSDKLSTINGGIITIAFMSAMIVAGVSYHINYRFSNVERTLDKIDKKISKNVLEKPKIANNP